MCRQVQQNMQADIQTHRYIEQYVIKIETCYTRFNFFCFFSPIPSFLALLLYQLLFSYPIQLPSQKNWGLISQQTSIQFSKIQKEKQPDMNKIKPQQKFQQLLNEFLHRHGPCQQYLNKLCYMLLTSKHKMESFYSQYQQKMDVFSTLKMLMLVHYTINYSVRLDEGMVDILGKVECEGRGKAEGFLKEVLVEKYRCFLQKRLYRQWERNQGVEGNEDDAVNEAYRNLNLLESGLGFVHELYTLGRYYVKKHEWIVDFVKGLAMDFCKIYLSIERKIYKVNPLHKEFNQLMIEVQRINDKLQNVYLNRYFARDVMKFSPKLMNRLSNPHRSEIKSSPHITHNKEQDQSTILPPLPEKKTIILQCLGEGFAYRELVNQANQ